MEKVINEFIEIYLKDSAIETVTYNNKKQKWIIKYDYDIPNDEFESVSDMIEYLNADQFGT